MARIKPKYVTFEQSKWLKEKGFDYYKLFEDFSDYYDYFDRKVQGRIHISDFSKGEDPDNNWIPVPEQHQVVEWLWLNHGIWIEVPFWDGKFSAKIVNTNTNVVIKGVDFEEFNSPQEGYSAAFDYIRENNLI